LDGGDPQLPIGVGFIGRRSAVGLLFAFSLVLDAVRGRQVHWYFALWLVFMVIWTVRFIGNVRWLRREGLNARE